MRKNAARWQTAQSSRVRLQTQVQRRPQGHRPRARPRQSADRAEMARRFLAGESASAIAADLNARGVPSPHSAHQIAKGKTPKGWGVTTVRQILTNPTMINKRVHRGEIVGDGTWEPILDRDDSPRSRPSYADPARRLYRRRAAVRMLSGIARCGVCGGPMMSAAAGATTGSTCVTRTPVGTATTCPTVKRLWTRSLAWRCGTFPSSRRPRGVCSTVRATMTHRMRWTRSLRSNHGLMTLLVFKTGELSAVMLVGWKRRSCPRSLRCDAGCVSHRCPPRCTTLRNPTTLQLVVVG